MQDLKNNSLKPSTLPAEAFDTSRLSKVALKEGKIIEDHPEFILLPERPTDLPPALTLTLKTQIFRFPPASISALKEIASPKKSTDHQNKCSWVSANAAISALVWRSVMAATYAHQLPIPESMSMFTSPLNARKRMDPPLEPELMASAWCFQHSRFPVHALLEAHIADVALAVRESIDKVDAEYIDSLISLIDTLPNPSLLMQLAFTDLLKSASMLTLWAGFRMYDFDWGGTLGGRCERVRTVAEEMFNGMQVVLP